MRAVSVRPSRCSVRVVEPLTIAEKALSQPARIQERLPWACPIERGTEQHTCHRAVVIGAGPVGLGRDGPAQRELLSEERT